jgi:hypothetical protein
MCTLKGAWGDAWAGGVYGSGGGGLGLEGRVHEWEGGSA